jgi:uncharacterized membrane protein YfcA
MNLPFGLSPVSALWVGMVLLIAAFVRGYSGFGFAALAVSGAGLVTNPLHMVPVVILCDAAMTLQQARDIWSDIDWGRVAPLALGALVGVPIGVHAMASVGIDAARAAISIYVLAMCVLLLAGLRLRRIPGRGAHAAIGVVSGLANGAAVGGLPVAVFFAAQPIRAAAFRATLIAYFTLLDLWTVPMLATAGLIHGDTLVASALALPILAFGIWAGSRRFLSAPPEGFRRFAIALLAVLAVLGLLKSVL